MKNKYKINKKPETQNTNTTYKLIGTELTVKNTKYEI